MEQILLHWGSLEAIPPELLTEDVQFVNAEDAIEPGIRRGQSGFAEAGSNFRRAYSALEIAVEREVQAADRIGLIVDMHLTGRGSGIDFHERMGWLFTIRDGQLARFEWSRDPEALLARLSA